MAAADIGHRALAANLSDLAAMGATPRYATLSIAAPAALPLAAFDDVVDGFLALAASAKVTLVGGNLSSSPGPLVVDVFAAGTVRPRRVLTRSGARAGDLVFVSGRPGEARAGLDLCRRGETPPQTTWRIPGRASCAHSRGCASGCCSPARARRARAWT